MDDFLSKEFKVSVIEEGFGKVIPKGSVVQPQYTGKFLDGRVFDSTYVTGKPVTIPVGIGAAIKGWDVSICSLKKGSKATIFCPPEYAYGDKGFKNVVPPNCPLIFDLEVLDFQEAH